MSNEKCSMLNELGESLGVFAECDKRQFLATCTATI
jgi:hypothetical protein